MQCLVVSVNKSFYIFWSDSSSFLFFLYISLKYSKVPADDTAAVRFLIFFLDGDDRSLIFISRLGIVAFCFILYFNFRKERSITILLRFQDWQYIQDIFVENTKIWWWDNKLTRSVAFPRAEIKSMIWLW